MQGNFEILSVWGTPRISVMVKAIETVLTEPYIQLYVETSGVVSFFLEKLFTLENPRI